MRNNRKIYQFLVVLLVSSLTGTISSCQSKPKQVFREVSPEFGHRKYINGPVKQVVFKTYNARLKNDSVINTGLHNGESGPGFVRRIDIGEILNFDPKGQLENEADLDRNDKPRAFAYYEYDKKGRKMFKKIYFYPPPPPKGKPSKTFVYQYDGDGNIKTEYLYGGGIDSYIQLKTHIEKKEIETKYHYDPYGNASKIESYGYYRYSEDKPPDTTITKFELKYDADKRLVRTNNDTLTYHTNGKLYRKTDITNGTFFEYYPDGRYFRYCYYGKSGRCETYDEQGYLISFVVANELHTKVVYDQHDKYGNWTRMLVYINPEQALMLLGEREITYYD